MTNEELAIEAKQGNHEYMHQLWAQVERLARYWSNQQARVLVNNGTAEDERNAFEDLFNGCCYPAMCEAVKIFDDGRGSFTNVFFYCFKSEASKFYGYKTEKRDPTLSAVSLNKSLGDGAEDLELIDLVADPCDCYDDPENCIYLGQLHETMKAAINDLDATQADVLRRRYYLGQSQRHIGVIYGIPPQYVHNLEHKALRSIRHGKYRYQLEEFLYPGGNVMPGGCGSGASAFRRYGSRATEKAALMRIDCDARHKKRRAALAHGELTPRAAKLPSGREDGVSPYRGA